MVDHLGPRYQYRPAAARSLIRNRAPTAHLQSEKNECSTPTARTKSRAAGRRHASRRKARTAGQPARHQLKQSRYAPYTSKGRGRGEGARFYSPFFVLFFASHPGEKPESGDSDRCKPGTCTRRRSRTGEATCSAIARFTSRPPLGCSGT